MGFCPYDTIYPAMTNPFRKYFGPSTLVAAAFIGPGTVTVCTLAGVRSGYSLLWALLFSIIATLVLQEMTGRLGIVTRKGLGEAIYSQLSHPLVRGIGILLVLSAILIGNIAYEGGNISGAVLGLDAFFLSLDVSINGVQFYPLSFVIGGIAFWLLFSGSFKRIVQVMTALVGLMSIVFVTTAVVIMPDLPSIAKGLFLPSASADELLTVIALVGTTVVPYNLFLHASTVQEKYERVSQLSDMRIENAVGIILGGIISMCIVITSAAAATDGSEVSSAADMAAQLEPLLGSWAKDYMGIGLFAAGITSAITAPLAAAYATSGILGWNARLSDIRFRLVWMAVLVVGVLFSAFSIDPVRLIEFAQVANGITLPVIAIFLLYIMNEPLLLGPSRNSLRHNIFGVIVILVALLIGFRSLNSVFGFM
ncbi:NRAMP (natural resistance-associated macrophage protein) metal ion transporters [Gracilimonas mengyeensis]|uniref:NRAMP (Natural resistance-associated macrophage protein) metal ion transporters n=2 Tax=Gracilimonas mengyeensis TaxID=1302730 RepID=A0A521C5H0_9BACT|nr:NRAMP (natural resistance-associated macrophage protein) metal ion transporters [Gracilimonas mengyeensis]